MNKRRKSNYESVNQSDPDRTRDEFMEEQEKQKEKKEKYYKTNLFKSRIINTEINACLVFQTVLYYNYFYAIMCFVIQLISLWIFVPDNIAFSRLFLVFFYLAFELIRLNRGYKANIQEQFPDFIFFIIFSVVLIPPCQFIHIIGKQVLPIDYATVLIEMLFIISEIVLATRSMINVTKRQAAVYYLRNTQTNIFSQEQKVKTSQEIEEELFYNFPQLKKINSNDSRDKHN